MSLIESPTSLEAATPHGVLLVVSTLAVYLAMGGHRLLVTSLAFSFEQLPLTALPVGQGPLLEAFLRISASVLAVALAISLPIWLALLLVDLGLGLLNRVAPRLEVFFLAMPAKVLMAALVLVGMLSTAVGVLTHELQTADAWLRVMVGWFSG